MSTEQKSNKSRGTGIVTNCNMNEELWFDFVESELDRTMQDDMKLHLKVCHQCQITVRDLKWIKKHVKPAKIELPDERVFNALHDKIMMSIGAVEAEHIEPIPAIRGRTPDFWRRRVLAPAAAAAAAFVLAFGALYKTSSFRAPTSTESLDRQAALEEQFLVLEASNDPEYFEGVIMSHQDTDDLVINAAAEKLSRMSDTDVRATLDNLK